MIGRELPHTLFFMNTKKAAGICVDDAGVIGIAREYMNSKQVTEWDIYNTILHELTHAAVGCQNGHNEIWHAAFKLLGGDGEICSQKPIDDDFYKYTIFCEHGCKWNRERLRQKFWKDKCCADHKSPLNIIKRN